MGDSSAILKSAAKKIVELPTTFLIRASSLYRTKPVGYLDQDPFINAILIVETGLNPMGLYTHLYNLEQEFHRVRLFKNGPRTLDLDLIAFDDVVQDDPKLTIPHPRAQERSFVLIPLDEADPEFTFADTNKTPSELLAALPQDDKDGVVKLKTKLITHRDLHRDSNQAEKEFELDMSAATATAATAATTAIAATTATAATVQPKTQDQEQNA